MPSPDQGWGGWTAVRDVATWAGGGLLALLAAIRPFWRTWSARRAEEARAKAEANRRINLDDTAVGLFERSWRSLEQFQEAMERRIKALIEENRALRQENKELRGRVDTLEEHVERLEEQLAAALGSASGGIGYYPGTPS